LHPTESKQVTGGITAVGIDRVLFGGESYRMLRGALNASAIRQKVVAENIANAEVPGYRPKEVQFEELLRESAAGPKMIPLASASSGHSIPADETAVPAPVVVESAPPDPALGLGEGDFDLERAMVELNENKVRYQALVTLISGRLLGLKNAIESR
jgi:flagellar basal-body rod protein FlgB